MSNKFKVGQKVITKDHQEDGTVVKVIQHDMGRCDYKVLLDRFADTDSVDADGNPVGVFTYFESDLEKWKSRRFRVDGNHYMQMYDDPQGTGGERLRQGTWGVRDTLTDQIVFYITSGAAKLIAQEVCKAMDEKTLLGDFAE